MSPSRCPSSRSQQDILKDQWSPALTIKTALISLQALLCAPQPDDPQDAEVASMFLNSHETYLHTAKFWTETYARPEADHSEVRARLGGKGEGREGGKGEAGRGLGGSTWVAWRGVARHGWRLWRGDEGAICPAWPRADSCCRWVVLHLMWSGDPADDGDGLQ
jgi:hypothetical protein